MRWIGGSILFYGWNENYVALAIRWQYPAICLNLSKGGENLHDLFANAPHSRGRTYDHTVALFRIRMSCLSRNQAIHARSFYRFEPWQ